MEAVNEMTVGEVITLALAMGRKICSWPYSHVVGSGRVDLTPFYIYLVLSQVQLRGLVRLGHVLSVQDIQDYMAQIWRMRVSLEHWLYSKLVYVSGMFVGVDQVQPLHDPTDNFPGRLQDSPCHSN